MTTLTASGRRRRSVAATVVVGLLLLGTAFGQDDDFPFGPFRMYATAQRLDGATNWYRVEAVTETGETIGIPISRFGMRRSELEGQIPRLKADVALVGDMVTAYERRQPGRARLVEVRIIKHLQPLRGGVPDGDPIERVAVTWTR